MAADLDHLNALFDEAAFAPERWGAVLEQAGAALNASLFSLLRFHNEGGEILGPEQKTIPHRERYYAGEWWRFDLRAARTKALAHMRIVADDELLAPGERETSEFYRGFAAEADAAYSLGWTFAVGERLFCFSTLRSGTQGPATPTERRALAEIRAKATQAAIVATHLEEAREHGLIASLEAAGMSALALNREGRVINATQSGRALLNEHFTLENGALAIKGGDAWGPLEALKADLKHQGPITRQGAFAIERPGQAPVLCTPLHHRTPTHQALSEVRAILILKDLAAPASVGADVLSQLYGLTPAEADVARHIAAGHSVEEVSRLRGVAEVTTRTILRAVFRKTGASRQGELAAILNRLV